MKSWTPPTNEMIDKVMASVKKETDRQYFFSRLNNPLWVEPLRQRGYFSSPPGLKQLRDGYVQYPHWPELSYLLTITEEVPDQVVEIILSLPKTDNPRVYDDVLAIALKLEGRQSAELYPKLNEYIELDNPFLAHRYPELLKHWMAQGNIAESLKVTKSLVSFREDPKAREKELLRKKNPKSLVSLLEPIPRFQQWEYQQILENGVRPLAEHEPYQVSRILIDAVASMIRLGIYQEDFEKGSGQDYSEIWCRRLDKPDREYQDVKGTLVQTLAYACEQVYDKAPESIDSLDQALRNHRWRVFTRLRQLLYASNLNDKTLPWIREQILGHDDYSKWEHHYEFQLMIRKASERFGLRLLSEDERKRIFDGILSGPSTDDYRAWMGESYTDESFQQHQRYFHRMQLRPFAVLLSGDVQRYFDELVGETLDETVTDDSYLPYGEVTGGTISYRSPKSVKDLESFTDEELLSYLNDWDEECRDKDNSLIEINISALADVFQSLFKKQIMPDVERLDFWLASGDRIARPVYVAAMLKAMIEVVKERNFENLDRWISFCTWILSHPDIQRVEGQPEPQDESRVHPDWGSSRRAVVDFIDACVKKDTDAPITARDGLGVMLRQVCSQFDWRLDQDCPVLLNRNDPITEAINNTRSRALESLVNFGFWVRRHFPEDHVSEVTDILTRRIAEDADIKLTAPEHALVGMHFGNLCTLNPGWANLQRKILFPQANEAVWRSAFCSFIRFNRPVKLTFEILRGDFEHAVANLSILSTEEGSGKDIVDRLGQHLFAYYLWEVYSLTGHESLLERFYDMTKNDRERWSQLFDHVGRSLKNSGRQLDKTLTARIIAFFDWRFEAAEPLELQEFTFWLEAECLEPDWRLQSYSKILDLDLEQGKGIGLSIQVRALNNLLPNHLALVVECFAKITDTMDQGTQIYILDEEAKPILKAGLKSEDQEVCNNAVRAQENLLRLGCFDYLEV
ncbi:hypothetical protein [Nitrincola iocasae]|uniref:hypothetical protein n=1 Tax=Nitrincola iocasae TaxID=2614693 RepID=UPI001780292E|nr:hypothetical protein [Nitrincola iocasae]